MDSPSGRSAPTGAPSSLMTAEDMVGQLGRLPRPAQWALVVAGSGLLAGLFTSIHLPAALLIGPMIVAIAAGSFGATIRLPRQLFSAAQTIIGCLIAASIDIGILSSFADDWPIIILAVVSTVMASSVIGWSLSQSKYLPGTTGVWGSSPGASTAMVLMASAFGADTRLVAFMLYLRVIIVTLTAAFVARLWVDTSGVAIPAIPWFPTIDPVRCGATLAVALAGAMLGRLLRLPSPFFLGAFILGTALHFAGLVSFQLPQWLLALSYMAIGWTIGLNFNRAVLMHALKALPQILVSILVLLSFCGGIAWLLTHELGIDPLTAYLATSPGGMDSVAIIAAASHNVNLSFVMALQTARFVVVLMVGPSIARLVARWVQQ